MDKAINHFQNMNKEEYLRQNQIIIDNYNNKIIDKSTMIEQIKSLSEDLKLKLVEYKVQNAELMETMDRERLHMKDQIKRLKVKKYDIKNMMSFKMIEQKGNKKENQIESVKQKEIEQEEEGEIDRVLKEVSKESVKEFLCFINKQEGEMNEQCWGWKESVECLIQLSMHQPLLSSYLSLNSAYQVYLNTTPVNNSSLLNKATQLCNNTQSKSNTKKMYILMSQNMKNKEVIYKILKKVVGNKQRIKKRMIEGMEGVKAVEGMRCEMKAGVLMRETIEVLEEIVGVGRGVKVSINLLSQDSLLYKLATYSLDIHHYTYVLTHCLTSLLPSSPLLPHLKTLFLQTTYQLFQGYLLLQIRLPLFLKYLLKGPKTLLKTLLAMLVLTHQQLLKVPKELQMAVFPLYCQEIIPQTFWKAFRKTGLSSKKMESLMWSESKEYSYVQN